MSLSFQVLLVMSGATESITLGQGFILFFHGRSDESARRSALVRNPGRCKAALDALSVPQDQLTELGTHMGLLYMKMSHCSPIRCSMSNQYFLIKQLENSVSYTHNSTQHILNGRTTITQEVQDQFFYEVMTFDEPTT